MPIRTAARALVLASLFLTGCQSANVRVVDAFPVARMAAPWTLQGAVWQGDFAAARGALGADAARWERHAPRRVWIGTYVNEDHADQRQTIRCFEFESENTALVAWRDACPPDSRSLDLADDGCWSATGVALRRGRFVAEVFGDDAAWSSEVSAAVLATQFARRLAANTGSAP